MSDEQFANADLFFDEATQNDSLLTIAFREETENKVILVLIRISDCHTDRRLMIFEGIRFEK